MKRSDLTTAMEDYLKAIFHLEELGETVGTAALATRLGVAAPSVTSMVKRMAEMGLVRHLPYQGVELTQVGRPLAVEVVRHHRLIELYLAEFLDVPWDRVHDEAERLEHVISEDLESRMAEKLGQVEFDPHGDPIPSCEGTFPVTASLSLWDVPRGERAVVARVSDRDAGVLGYLAERGLLPGTVVEVIEVSPFGGTFTVRVGGNDHVLGRDVAAGIRVWPAPVESPLESELAR